MVRLSRASRPIHSDVVTAGVRNQANYGSTTHFGVVHKIVVRLSRASRLINSDVVTASVKARRIMVQLSIAKFCFDFRERVVHSFRCYHCRGVKARQIMVQLPTLELNY